MATTAKKTAAKPPVPPRKTIVTKADTTAGDVVESTQDTKISLAKPVEPDSPMVTAVVPKRFTLTRDDGTPVAFEAGVQEMHKSDALHWFSVASGVTIYTPKV